MKALTLRYERLCPINSSQRVKIGVEYSLEEGESLEGALACARAFVACGLRQERHRIAAENREVIAERRQHPDAKPGPAIPEGMALSVMTVPE